MSTGRLSSVSLAVGLLFLVAAAGCGGGEFGEKVSVPVEQKVQLDSPFAQDKSVSYPQAKPFNVFDAQRTSSGMGKADSWAKTDGTAHAEAASSGIGKATAEFQVGQILDSGADTPVNVTATFKVDYDYVLDADEFDLTKPLDKLALKVYVRDSNGQVIYRDFLAQLGSGPGPDRFSGQDKPAKDLTLEPGLAYHFVVAARIEVEGTAESGVTASIDIKSFELELGPRNADSQ